MVVVQYEERERVKRPTIGPSTCVCCHMAPLPCESNWHD